MNPSLSQNGPPPQSPAVGLVESRLLQVQTQNSGLKLLISERKKAISCLEGEIRRTKEEQAKLENSTETLQTIHGTLKR